MPNSINFPWSGPVTQAINPWELWIKSLSSQMGFINIRNVTTSDHRIEQEVIEDVASYGKQLGKINDLLVTLVENPGLENLSDEQQRTVSEFTRMVADIERIKAKWNSQENLSTAIDGLIAELKSLKSRDPARYDSALARLRDGLDITPRKRPAKPVTRAG